MRKQAVILLMSLFAGVSAYCQSFDSLWKKYSGYLMEDRPQDAIGILEKIQEKARVERSDWDFYEASEQKRIIQTNRAYSRGDEYRRLCREERAAYGSAVIDLYEQRYQRENLDSFIRENRDRLKAGRHEEFYRDWAPGSGFAFSSALPSLMENDYELGLWILLSRSREYGEKTLAEFTGKYPQGPLVEFFMMDKTLRKDLEEYSRRYAGKAVALFSEKRLLELRAERLESDASATSDDFRTLRQDCVEFDRKVKACRNEEKALADCFIIPNPMIEKLDAEEIEFTIGNSELTMVCRNRKEVDFSLKDESGKTVFQQKLLNGRNSYHLRDTVRLQLPALDDGKYKIITNKAKLAVREAYYEKYTLSLYSRTDAAGTGIFVTDHITGEPLDRVNLSLVSDGKITEFKGVELKDGFAYIPCRLDTKHDNTLTVWTEDASGRKRSSSRLGLNANWYRASDKDEICAQLLTDKGAYTPGERINYKVILYYKGSELRQAPEGMKVKVSFNGADWKTLRTDVLTTGSMGSANGSFSTAGLERPGRCPITVHVDDKELAVKYVRVDEFILPDYDVVWDGSWDISTNEDGDFLLRGSVKNFSGKPLDPSSVSYNLHISWYGDSSQSEDESGFLDCGSDGSFCIRKTLPAAFSSAYFRMTVKIVDAAGQVQEFHHSWHYSPSRENQSGKESFVFHELDIKGSTGAKVIAGKKPVWVLAELFGRSAEVLERKVVRIDPGEGGVASSEILFQFRKDYPELMAASLHYFHDGSYEHWGKSVRKHPDTYDLPLEFTSFTDMTGPQSLNKFMVHTLPGVEVCLSVFDKSSEAMNPNSWDNVQPLISQAMSIPYHTEVCGTDRSVFFGMLYKASNRVATLSTENDALVFEEEAIPFMLADPKIRSDFRTTLAWEPELRSDRNGDLEFRVKAADKLSTFVVQLFAHDAKMRNTVLRREMLVTLPVQLTVQPPRYLYDGDRCLLRFSLSNNFDRTVRGTFSAEGKDIRLEIPAKGTVPVGIDLDVAGLAGSEKTVTAIFRPEEEGLAGDAIKISIPVRSQRQTLVEAHSAVLPFGADPGTLEKELRSRFANAPGASASMSCISIREMLDKALPEFLAPQADNVIDNLNALYSDVLLRGMGRQGLDDKTREEIRGKVIGCLNSDGGFAWFKGMKSSPMITAWVMETSARAGLEGIVNAATAAYLDASILGEENTPTFRFMPCSVEAYAYVRSLYPQFAFKTSALDRKALRKIRKSLKKSLVPSGDRGKQGNTSGKVRRVLTLNALLDAPELARAWGLGSVGKLRRSAEADMESLRQYACPHHSGGMYYPGASGAMFHMLDGELYVHTLLCELFEGTEIADGIRLWFMLQKESQQWKNDPAFVEALACVQKAPQKILDTRVMALSADFTLPFDDIRAAGNGFKVQTAYFKDGKPLAEGDSLKVGDRITVVTDFSSDDMRSFVRLTVPRPANLRPVDQKSSIFWGGWYAVRADRTEYWLETCSERMQVREDCYVTAEGCFHSAARSIECLYAPHYRANEKAPGALVSRF